jgi:DNA-directed RNA polymerase specialized sigma24 family protein
VLATFPYHRMIDALDQLSTEVQEVVFSVDVHGCRMREIAEIMHIPHGTVLSRLRRALKRSRAQVAEVPNDLVCNGFGEGAA